MYHSLMWAIPFIGLLLSLSIGPLFLKDIWHKYDVYIICGWGLLICLCQAISFGISPMSHDLSTAIGHHYLPFILLIGTLYIISGGIHITMRGHATPLGNVAFLMIGSLLASLIGTTGAAILLIRPFINLNKFRKHKSHLVIFFIFSVANMGGCLTPLGDPPLFIGFLNGVAFSWPFVNLLLPFLMALTILLTLFWIIDRYYFFHDPKVKHPEKQSGEARLTIQGQGNILFLALVMVVVLLSGSCAQLATFNIMGTNFKIMDLVRDSALLMIGIASWRLTPPLVHRYNHFSWGPLKEVAVVFLAIFITIGPVIEMLQDGKNGPFSALYNLANPEGHSSSFLYFWLCGALSAFLDNAPTYLVFFHMAGGNAENLMGPLSTTLQAISLGAVFMGALTYIGNAPNFMVRALAEKAQVRMPGFLGYMGWSLSVLGPIFSFISYIFFW